MIIKEIHYTTNFVKKWRKLNLQEKTKYKKKIKVFQQNPFDSKLKTHKLKGKLAGFWSFSLTYQQRILFKFLNKRKALFYDFGSHQIYR